MFTAKTMQERLDLNNEEKGSIVDKWLEEVVLPKKMQRYTSGFSVPKGLTCKELEILLKVRGFEVKTWYDHQGSFVSVSIPPQDK